MKRKMDLEEIKTEKELLEQEIFRLCQQFEIKTKLSLEDISLVVVNPPLHQGLTESDYNNYLEAKPKLMGISLELSVS